MLAVFAGQAVCSVFLYRLQLVQFIFAEAFDTQIGNAQSKADHDKHRQEDNRDLSIFCKKKIVGKQLGIDAGSCCRKGLI